jgi:hypothetical protein
MVKAGTLQSPPIAAAALETSSNPLARANLALRIAVGTVAVGAIVFPIAVLTGAGRPDLRAFAVVMAAL